MKSRKKSDAFAPAIELETGETEIFSLSLADNCSDAGILGKRGTWENGNSGLDSDLGKREFGLEIQRRVIGTIAGKMGIWDFEVSFAFSPVLAFEIRGQSQAKRVGNSSHGRMN